MADDPDPGAEPAQPLELVAIDGPSGAGKSSVARRLAEELGFAYLDTGAMYRAATWFFLEKGLPDLEDRDRVGTLLDELEVELRPDGSVLVCGRDVTPHLRSQEVESRVSAISALPALRERMRELQRRLARAGPLVAEGRDMTSVVFPNARWKFYLDAEPAERARRRRLDFERRGRAVSPHQVLEELAVRDRLDSTRRDAPLRRTPDARYVDTTGLGLDEVVAELLRVVRSDLEGFG